jgi:hypothetical protein
MNIDAKILFYFIIFTFTHMCMYIIWAMTDYKKDMAFLLVCDKDSYTERDS